MKLTEVVQKDEQMKIVEEYKYLFVWVGLDYPRVLLFSIVEACTKSEVSEQLCIGRF